LAWVFGSFRSPPREKTLHIFDQSSFHELYIVLYDIHTKLILSLSWFFRLYPMRRRDADSGDKEDARTRVGGRTIIESCDKIFRRMT